MKSFLEADVVVMGGGPAGCATVLTLAKAHRKIVLLEAQTAQEWKVGETLAPESREVLQSLGVLDQLLLGRHLPSYGNCSAWATDTLLEKDFIFSPFGEGWQLDRSEFDQMLRGAARSAGANVLERQSVTIIRRMNDSWEIMVGTEVIRTPWLIDATGHRCSIARKQGMRRIAKDRLVSIFALALTQNGSDMDTRTFIESSPDGWWYSVLTPNRHRTVAFQTDVDILKNAQSCIGTWFQKKLSKTRHLSSFLARHHYTFNHVPSIMSAQSTRLVRPCGGGWLAVGDASLSFDPLSGQGILKALLSGRKAAEAILEDTTTAVENYEAWTNLIWHQYLSSWNSYYVLEQRWSTHPFWKRRHLAAQID